MRVVHSVKCPREVSQNQLALVGEERVRGARRVGGGGGGGVLLPNADSSRAVNRDITQHSALTRKIIVNIDFFK